MIDLIAVDRDGVLNCLTPRLVFAMAEAAATNGTGRDVLVYLMQTAVNLTALGCTLSQAYTEDTFEVFKPAVTQRGLGPDRQPVLAAAATCAHNAALFLQEAQRRSAHRRPTYDPLTVAQPT